MAFCRAFVASLVIALLLSLNLVEPHLAFESQMTTGTGARRSLLSVLDCGGACAARCSLSSRPNLCKRACASCCSRCKCVPSGTSGNYNECSCYANLTTHGNKRKCP